MINTIFQNSGTAITLSAEVFVWIVILAIGIGILASLFGIGGGFLLVPTMILILGVETHVTVATASFIIMFMSLSSMFAYLKQKRLDFKLILILSLTNVLGSVIGALITEFVAGQTILILFGTIEATLAIILGTKKTPQEKKEIESMKLKEKVNASEQAEHNQSAGHSDTVERTQTVKQSPNREAIGTAENPKSSAKNDNEKNHWYIIYRDRVDAEGIHHKYKPNLLYALPTAFIAGFLSSLLGIGGGTLYIQIFVFLCGMEIHMAIANSVSMIFFSAFFSTITFAEIGLINYSVGIAYSIGMVIGAQLGALISRKIESKMLKKLASLIIVIIALRMIILALLNQ